jgi:DNA-directed RNA polymerase subunit RPC12/RpoP
MSIATLGEAFDAGWRVTVRCAWGKRDGMKTIRECLYKAELDMETLVCTRGRDFPLSWLQERLRCPRCGSRRMVVMYEPPSNIARGRATTT